MPIICRLIEEPSSYMETHPGDIWFINRDQGLLSAYYREHNSHRKPLMVKLPSGDFFCVDGPCYSAEQGAYGGWQVTGEAPNITVAPSIHLVGRYHGFLTNGVLSDPL